MWSSEDEDAPQMTRVVDALRDHLDEVIGDKEEPVDINAKVDEVGLKHFKKMVKLIKVESVTGIEANFADPLHALDEIIHQVTEEESEDALAKLKINYCQLIEERDELYTRIELLETSLKEEKITPKEYLSLVNDLEKDVERLKNCNQQLRDYYEENLTIKKNNAVEGNQSELKELYFFLNLENAKLIKKNEDLIHDFVEAKNKIHDLENGNYFYRHSSNKFDEPNYPDLSVPPPNITSKNEMLLPSLVSPSYTPCTVPDKSILSVCSLDSPIPDINVPLISPTVLPINSQLQTKPREAEENQTRPNQQPKDFYLAHESGNKVRNEKDADGTDNDEENDMLADHNDVNPELTNNYEEKLEPDHSPNNPELAGNADMITKPANYSNENFDLADHGDEKSSKPASFIVPSILEVLQLPPASKSTQTDLFDLRNSHTNASDLKHDNNKDMLKGDKFGDEPDDNLNISMKRKNLPTFAEDPAKLKTSSSDFLQEFISDLDDHTPPFIQKLLQDYATPPDSPNRLVDSLPNQFPTAGEDINSLQGFKSEEIFLIEQLGALGFSVWTLTVSVKSCGVDVNKVIHRCLVLDMLVGEGNSTADVEEVVQHFHHLESSEDACRWHLHSFKKLRDVGFHNKDIHEALLLYPGDYKAALHHLIQCLV